MSDAKLWFRIGEVSELLGVKPHVLRFWEGEFKRWVRPERSRRGQRVYSRRDVDRLQRIRELLHVERYTIEGAKMRMQADAALAAATGVNPLGLERVEQLG